VWVVAFERDFTDFKIGTLWFSAMPMSGLENVVTTTIHYYVFLVCICLASLIGISGRVAYTGQQQQSYRSLRKAITFSFGDYLRNAKWVTPLLQVAAITLLAFSLWHFASLDSELLFQNFSYLTITDPYAMGLENSLLIIYHSLYRLVGLISGPLSLFLFFSGRKLTGFLFLLLWIYGLGMLTITASRFSSIYLFSMSLFFFAFGNTTLNRIVGFAFTVAGIFALLFSIQSRTSNVFGASVLISNLVDFRFDLAIDYLNGLFFNVFEGAINVANSINLSPELPARYQMLSLSPLVSAIDNFESIRNSDRAKFAQFVPMGAFGEVYVFDPVFKVVFFAALFSTFRYISAAKYRLGQVKFLLITVFLVYVFYLLPSYSVRTTWRFLFLFGIILPLWKYVRCHLPKKPAKPRADTWMPIR